MALTSYPGLLPLASTTGSTLVNLEGSLTGARFEADSLIGTDPADERPLLARYDLDRAARTLTKDAISERRAGGLWRWSEVLPVRSWEYVTYLGEGSTPLLPTRRLAAEFGLRQLFIKAESLNPTGSFKARGMAVAVSRARELGAAGLVAPSAGNAAGALAAYAAAAGLSAVVIMPSDAPRANMTEVLVTGGQLILMDGLISDCGRLAKAIAQVSGAFDLSTLKEPYRVEGKKTLGLELAEDFGWELPDVIVYPTGGGTGMVGMWKAFDELETMGLIGSQRPRMVSVQAEGCAPIVNAFQTGARFATPWVGATTRAAGIRVPGAIGDFLILDCIRASGGTAIAVPEQAILETQSRIGALGAGFTSLETSAAFAALQILVETSAIDRGERVVVFDTGAGFKSEAPQIALPEPISRKEDEWDAVLDRIEKGRSL